MMDIPDSLFTIELHITMKSISAKLLSKWKKLQEGILSGSFKHVNIDCETRDALLSIITDRCLLPSNQNLPLLNRVEGGIGRDNNIKDKQIRLSCENYTPDIILSVLNSDDNTSKWTFEELKDILQAFIQVCDDYMESECCEGSIVLTI